MKKKQTKQPARLQEALVLQVHSKPTLLCTEKTIVHFRKENSEIDRLVYQLYGCRKNKRC